MRLGIVRINDPADSFSFGKTDSWSVATSVEGGQLA